MPRPQNEAQALPQAGGATTALAMESKGPVLEKLVEAFGLAARVYAVGAGLAELPPLSRMIQERQAVSGSADFLQCGVMVSWRPEDATLALGFKGSHQLFDKVVHDDRALSELVPPFYLRHLRTGARVVGPFQEAFERLHGGVLGAVRELLGDTPPRRVLCCGYCAGGALAALAGPWAALAYPSADVRCITFGAPRVGNSEFQRVFSWLVGLSYRAVYRFDPIPDKPRPRVALSLNLHAVGSDVFFDGRTAQQLQLPLRFHYELSDHFMSGYVAAAMVAGDCSCPLPVTPLGQACLVEPEAVAAAPELDQRGDCTGRDARGSAAATTVAVGGLGSAGSGGGGDSRPGAPAGVPSEAAAGEPAPPAAPPLPASATQDSPGAAPQAPVAPAAVALQAAVDAAAARAAAAPETGPAGGRGQHAEQGGWSCAGWLCRGSGPGTRGTGRVLSGAGAGASNKGGSKGVFGGGGGLRQGSSPRKQGPAAVDHSAPSTALDLHSFWGELQLQVQRIQAMYADFLASGGAQSAMPLAPWADAYLTMAGGESSGVEQPAGKATPAAAADRGKGVAAGGAAVQHVKPAGLAAEPAELAGRSAELAPPGSKAQGAEASQSPASGGGGDRPGGVSASYGGGQQEDQTGGPAGGEPAPGADDMGGTGLQGWAEQGGEHSLEELLKVSSAGRLRRAALCAYASYFGLEEFEDQTGLRNAVLVEDPRTDAQAYVAYQPSGTAVFVFRGTANRSDAAADLKFWRRQVEFLPHSFPGCKAHLGFLLQFVGVTSASDPGRNLGAALGALTGGRQPGRIVCIGHSLGGALATLGATWAALQYPHADVHCISFGSPRVGNRKFVRAFQTLVGTRLRVVHGADPVPAIPPAFRYCHVEPGLYLRGPILRLWREQWPRHFMFRLEHHLMKEYLSSLETVLHHAGAAVHAVAASAGAAAAGAAAQAQAGAQISPQASKDLGKDLEEAPSPTAAATAGTAGAAGQAPHAAAQGAPAMPAAGAQSAAPQRGPQPGQQLGMVEEGKEGAGQGAEAQEARESALSLQQAEGMLGEVPLLRLLCRA